MISSSFVNKRNLQFPGYTKIKAFCEVARQLNLDWAWVDTCCIDKSSSAELSEAINSMFRWYGHAAVCIVHLSDCHVTLYDRENEDFEDVFSASEWFTRGVSDPRNCGCQCEDPISPV